jgi:hypothetical protein
MFIGYLEDQQYLLGMTEEGIASAIRWMTRRYARRFRFSRPTMTGMSRLCNSANFRGSSLWWLSFPVR